jgi:translation initiation factor 2 alpha subunit (eIF-2alpha)
MRGHQVIGEVNPNTKSDSGFYVILPEHNNLEAFISYKNVSRSKWIRQMYKSFDIKKLHCFNVIESVHNNNGEKPIINLSYKEMNEESIQEKRINEYNYRERLSNLFHNFASELFKNKKKQEYPNKKDYKQWEQNVVNIPLEQSKLMDEYLIFLKELFERSLWKIPYGDLNIIVSKLKSGEMNLFNDKIEKELFNDQLYRFFPDPKYELLYQFKLITRSFNGYHQVINILNEVIEDINDKKGKIEINIVLRKTPNYIITMVSKELELMNTLLFEIIEKIKSKLTKFEKYNFIDFTQKNLLSGSIQQLNEFGQPILISSNQENKDILDENTEDDEEPDIEEKPNCLTENELYCDEETDVY